MTKFRAMFIRRSLSPYWKTCQGSVRRSPALVLVAVLGGDSSDQRRRCCSWLQHLNRLQCMWLNAHLHWM